MSRHPSNGDNTDPPARDKQVIPPPTTIPVNDLVQPKKRRLGRPPNAVSPPKRVLVEAQVRSEQIHQRVAEIVNVVIDGSEFTQSEIARKTEIPHTTLAHWRRGTRKPSVGHLAIIAEFFQTTVDKFYEGTYSPTFEGESEASRARQPYNKIIDACVDMGLSPDELGNRVRDWVREELAKDAEEMARHAEELARQAAAKEVQLKRMLS